MHWINTYPQAVRDAWFAYVMQLSAESQRLWEDSRFDDAGTFQLRAGSSDMDLVFRAILRDTLISELRSGPLTRAVDVTRVTVQTWVSRWNEYGCLTRVNPEKCSRDVTPYEQELDTIRDRLEGILNGQA